MDRQEIIYDESLLPGYSLPDPLLFADGTRVVDAKMWMERRRPEVLGLFERHVYGRMPGLSQPVTSTIGYHIRPGVHDVMDYDWERYMDFADFYLPHELSGE